LPTEEAGLASGNGGVLAGVVSSVLLMLLALSPALRLLTLLASDEELVVLGLLLIVSMLGITRKPNAFFY